MALAESEDGLEKQLLDLRSRVAFYGSTRTYEPVFAAHGQEELGRQLHEMSVTNRWADMPGTVPVDVVREFVTAGTWDSMPGEIERRLWYASRVSIDAGAESPADEERLAELIERVQGI